MMRGAKKLGRTILRTWQRSLKVRIMTIAGVLTGIMFLTAGTFVLSSVSDDLYQGRLDEVLQDSARATEQAQLVLEGTTTQEARALAAAVHSMRGAILNVSSSDGLVFKRQQGQDYFVDAPQDIFIGTHFLDLISSDLTDALERGEAVQYWEPIAFQAPDGSAVPGIAVGTTLTLPGQSGVYNLLLGYDLGDTQKTYSFLVRILLISAFFLMILMGSLVLAVSNAVFRPIRIAADTSRRIALGESDARIPLQNDEHFDMLSENFNQMADSLQNRIDELDTLSEMQQRFVSDVSHELRTPLTTVKLATQVLSSNIDKFEGPQVRAVEVMGEQVDRFESLLTDLLEISRYDAGRVSISRESTNIVHLVEDVVLSLQPLSEQEIQVRAAGGFNPIDVDPRRIRRIVSNLVGNAIEHGEDKPILVTVDSNQTAVAVAVRDFGIGMSADAVTHVFDRFWRADPSRKRTLGGTGLGLAIAREDAAVHGGQLEVWSRPGQGTNFMLTLPTGEHPAGFYSPLALTPEGEES